MVFDALRRVDHGGAMAAKDDFDLRQLVTPNLGWGFGNTRGMPQRDAYVGGGVNPDKNTLEFMRFAFKRNHGGALSL